MKKRKSVLQVEPALESDPKGKPMPAVDKPPEDHAGLGAKAQQGGVQESATNMRKRTAAEVRAMAEEAIRAGKLPSDFWTRQAAEALGSLRGAISKYLFFAEAGDEGLLFELPIYTRQMVQACNKLARQHPQAMAPIAAEWIEWPVLASWHYPKRKDFSDLAARLGLGTGSLVLPPAKATWKPDTPINRFLLDFFQGGVDTEKSAYIVNFPPGTPKLSAENWPWFLDEIVMPYLDDIREEEGWEGIPVIHEIIKAIAYEPDQRSAVRNRIKKALRALAAGSG